MKHNIPNHFSYDFKLNLDKFPAKKSDRIALKLLIPGLLSALLLITIGIYELIKGQNPYDDKLVAEVIAPWFSLAFFDLVMILLGGWIIFALFSNYLRYKKVFCDGKKITMIYRNPQGRKTTIKEAIKKYQGVRFRVEFFQYGFITKNKYIIELFHDDFDKVAPLYISTSSKDIRNLWEYYARKLKLPQIIMTDEGFVKRDVKDIGKSLQQLDAENNIKYNFDFNAPLPSSISWVRKRDKSVIKNRKIRWDGYNILLLALCAIILTVFAVAYKTIILSPFKIGITLISCLMILYIVAKSLTKDKLVIKPRKIVIVHKTFFLSRKKDELMKDDIESIDVTLNPVSSRYFITIVGKDKTLIFGKKLPVDDLRWIKGFLMHDILKK